MSWRQRVMKRRARPWLPLLNVVPDKNDDGRHNRPLTPKSMPRDILMRSWVALRPSVIAVVMWSWVARRS